jgi:putative transcriptional regulator
MSALNMPQHHPDQFMLNDYAAGSLPGALALSVAAHLEFCAQCRRESHQLQALGAQLLETLDPVPVADTALESLLRRIDAEPARQPVVKKASTRPVGGLPRVLRQLVPAGVDDLEWSRAGSLRTSRLAFGDRSREVTLQHIAAGGRVLEHGHRGNEITVVLQGSFFDKDGCYQPGDFLLRGPEHVHRPEVDSSGDCLCLAVLDAPLRFGGLLGLVANPFMRIHPR